MTSTTLLFLAPELIRREPIDAVTQLRPYGGVAGGLVAGYLTDGRHVQSLTNGIKAALYGLVGLYLLYVAYNIAHAIVVAGYLVPPLYVIVVLPLLIAFSLFGLYLLGGAVGGVVGNWVRRTTTSG